MSSELPMSSPAPFCFGPRAPPPRGPLQVGLPRPWGEPHFFLLKNPRVLFSAYPKSVHLTPVFSSSLKTKMSDKPEQQFLHMAALAGDEPIPEPGAEQSTESPAAPREVKRFILMLNGDPKVRIIATRKREFANGEEASYNLQCFLGEVQPPAGKTPEQLEKGDKVTFITGDDSVIAATVVKIHKEQRGKRPKVTLHTVWRNDQVEPAEIEPSPSSTKRPKRKAEPAGVDSEPESKARKLALEVSKKVVFAIFLSLDDFLKDKPSLTKIRARMEDIKGHLAHLLPPDMPAGKFIHAVLDPCIADYIHEQFKDDPDAALVAMQGFALLTSEFSPKEPLDLVAVKDFLRRRLFRNGEDESFSLVLGYDNASVVNETLPDMAFGDNKRALECAAARAQSPEPSDSESNTEPNTEVIDLSSDDE
jgi:hypothetical protein